MFKRKSTADIWRERQEKRSDKIHDSPNKSYPDQMSGGDYTGQARIKKNEGDGYWVNIKKETSEGYEELRHEDVLRERSGIKTQHKAKLVLKHGGTFIFIVSLAATIIVLFPFLRIDTKAPSVQNKTGPTIDLKKENVEAKVIKEAESLGLDARFSIYVPKINAKSVVIENVDMSNESEYLAALKKGVAHGRGTYFPGQGQNIFLFSHSVSAPEYVQTYNAVFYNLKDLGLGDEIIIFFSGQKFVYKVSEKVVTTPRDVSFLAKDYGGEALILQTCDPPGTTLRRLLVIAKPV
jgi:LPXTG-site transpeptidase (sortase) family protein